MPAINKVLANVTRLRHIAKNIHTSNGDDADKQELLEGLNEEVESLQKKMMRDMREKRIY